MTVPLDDLLAPVGLDAFLQSHWQTAPLWIARDDPSIYADTITAEDVHRLVGARAGQEDFILSVIGGKGRATKTIPRREWTPDAVAKRYTDGATIRIGDIAALAPGIRTIAQAFEGALTTDAFINLYLTPPTSHAFGAHCDDHDVFILQLEGTKVWELYDTPRPAPLEVRHPGRAHWFAHKSPFDPPRADGVVGEAPSQVVELSPGDLLYVPRGLKHSVKTTDQISLHLTVATPVLTWYEVAVHALLSSAAAQPDLRKAISPGFTHETVRSAQDAPHAAKAIGAIKAALTPDVMMASLDELALRFALSRPAPDGDTAQITLATRLMLRPGLVYYIRPRTMDSLVLFADQAIPIPARAHSMLDHMVLGAPFAVSELPTHLSDQSRLVVAAELLKSGFLVRAPGHCG